MAKSSKPATVKEAINRPPRKKQHGFVPFVPAEKFDQMQARNDRQKKRAAFWKRFAANHPPTETPRKIGKSPALAAPYGEKANERKNRTR